jgi:hypothetical protein
MYMGMSCTALHRAINEMPIPFYRITVSKNNNSYSWASEIIKEYMKDKEFIRTELVTDENYERDDWSIALYLKNLGEDEKICEIKSEE